MPVIVVINHHIVDVCNTSQEANIRYATKPFYLLATPFSRSVSNISYVNRLLLLNNTRGRRLSPLENNVTYINTTLADLLDEYIANTVPVVTESVAPLELSAEDSAPGLHALIGIPRYSLDTLVGKVWHLLDMRMDFNALTSDNFKEKSRAVSEVLEAQGYLSKTVRSRCSTYGTELRKYLNGVKNAD